jgi:hypothetical protein
LDRVDRFWYLLGDLRGGSILKKTDQPSFCHCNKILTWVNVLSRIRILRRTIVTLNCLSRRGIIMNDT